MAKTIEYIDHTDLEGIKATLLGKRVVSVDERRETISLSDGTVLSVIPSEGSGYGGDGYFLEALSSVENAITSVGMDQLEGKDGFESFVIFVYAEGVAKRQELLKVTGKEGNGYYGTGFSLQVSLQP